MTERERERKEDLFQKWDDREREQFAKKCKRAVVGDVLNLSGVSDLAEIVLEKKDD